ncbi:MAG: MmcQ/YjbR family DNA-binding protein [Pyrinomonadaceae bacterium]
MDIESVRKFCLSLPHVTEDVQWENDLLLRIGNKMFTVISLEPASDHCMSFKCTPEKFGELTEQDGIMPAPYVARYHWVALERFDVLPERELKTLLKTAYELVRDKLPKKIREGLTSNAAVSSRKSGKTKPTLPTGRKKR